MRWRHVLILVRHGVTDWNEEGRLMGRAPIPLNSRGRLQARAVAEALRHVPLARILASPQRRAQETAAVIAAPHGLAVETEPGIDEVWVGHWQGRSFAELATEPDVLRYVNDPAYECDAIEPLSAILSRVLAVFQRLRAQPGDGPVLLVSHGDPLRALVAAILKLQPARFRSLAIDPGSISAIRCEPDRERLVLLNWVPAEWRESPEGRRVEPEPAAPAGGAPGGPGGGSRGAAPQDDAPVGQGRERRGVL